MSNTLVQHGSPTRQSNTAVQHLLALFLFLLPMSSNSLFAQCGDECSFAIYKPDVITEPVITITTPTGESIKDLFFGCTELVHSFRLCNLCDNTPTTVTISFLVDPGFVETNLNGYTPQSPIPDGRLLYTKIVTLAIPPPYDSDCAFCLPDCPVITGPVGYFSEATENDKPAASFLVDGTGCTTQTTGNQILPNLGQNFVLGGLADPADDVYNCNTLSLLSGFGRVIYINQDLVLGGGFSYCWNSKDIYIAKGASIIVEPGANLTVIESSLKTCFGDTWHGVDVKVDGGLDIKDGSVIENADFGITAYMGSTVEVNNTKFIDNKIGVYLESGKSDVSVSNSAFYGSRKIPNIGIKALDNSTVFANSCTFKNMNYGIHAQNCDVNSYNNTFNDMKKVTLYNGGDGIYMSSDKSNNLVALYNDYQNCTGHGQYLVRNIQSYTSKSSFSACPVGITSQRSKGLTLQSSNIDVATQGVYAPNSEGDIVLTQNDINTTRNGVQFDGLKKNALIENNTRIFGQKYAIRGSGISVANAIEIRKNKYIGAITDYGITINTASPKMTQNTIECVSGIGVKIANVNETDLICNDITGNGPNGVSVSVSPNSRFNSNTIAGQKEAAFFSSSSKDSDFAGNRMSATGIGLHLDGAAVIGEQAQKGNLWYSCGAVCNGDYLPSAFTVSTDMAVGPFALGTPNNVHLLPSPMATPFGWFETPSYNFEDIYNYEDQCAKPGAPNPIRFTPNDGVFIGESLSEETKFRMETTWVGRYQTYRKFYGYQALLADAGKGAASFMENEYNTSIGKLYEVERAIAALYAQSESDKKEAQVQDNTLHSLAVQWKEIEDKSIAAKDLSEKEQLRNQRNQIRTSFTKLSAEIADRNQKEVDTVKKKAVEASLFNETIETGDNLQAENQKQVNFIILGRVQQPEQDWGKKELTNLVYIANQCPLKGGPAVHTARGLYAELNPDAYYNDEKECQVFEGTKDASRVASTLETALLSPNPATDHITINASMTGAKILIYNSLQQLVLSYQLGDEEYTGQLNISNLVQGIYTCILYNNTEKRVSTQKLSIIR